jgi:hypothetical protein
VRLETEEGSLARVGRMIALNMRAQSLRGFLGLAGVLGILGVACSSTPARVAAPPAPPPEKEVVEVKEPEPPPEPLATADVAFEQKWDFVKLSLMDVRSDSDFMPEDEIVKKLPTAQRFEYQSVQRARKQLLATEDRMNASRRGMHKAGKAGAAQYKLTLVARQKARDAVVKAVAKAEQSITQAMEKKPSAELGLALTRLRASHPELRYNDTSRTLAYGFTETNSDSAAAIEPLRKAAALTALDSTGKYVRLELIHHLMATADAKDAKPYINELLGVVAWDEKPLLLFRLGVLQSLEKQDALAAETFRSAHEHLATSSGVDRKTLLMAEVAARYRAQQFDRVLDVAAEHWTEWGDPKPLKPDPNPPPPPPPAPKVKGKSISSGAQAAGILGVLNSSNFSVLGALGSQSSFSDADVLRFATDAAERQSLDPAQMKGTPEFRAGIASRLAARAFYRNDDEAAKAAGETAKSLGGTASREGLRVLKALAKRAGDTQASTEIDAALAKASYGRGTHASGIEHAYLDEELREKKSADAKPSTTPVVERNIRSLVRLCLEPVYQRMPEKSELVVSAKVFPDGKVEPVVEAAGGSDVSACLKQMASRVLAHAPSSVSAKVAVARLEPERQRIWGGGFGSIFGDDSIGESFGAGGLGLSGIGVGGGGSGDSIGLGRVGGWGTGSGIGRGGGQLGGKVKKKPSPKKPITVPKKK